MVAFRLPGCSVLLGEKGLTARLYTFSIAAHPTTATAAIANFLINKGEKEKMTMGITIERIAPPSAEAFYKNYVVPGKPVVVTGFVNKWPGFGKWTIDYLVNTIGDRKIPITTIVDGDYCNATRSEMKLAEYIRYLETGQDPRKKLYLAELPVHKYFTDLEDEMVIPEFVISKKETSCKSAFYVGKNNFSQLHYHQYGSAVNCVLYGEKTIRLFPPSETRFLYKYPWYSKMRNMSKTTALMPDPTVFPDFNKAAYGEVVLKAGEMLFIPIYWWHSIQNYDINIATVIYWGRDSWHRFPAPVGLKLDYFYTLLHELPETIGSIPKRVLHRISGAAR